MRFTTDATERSARLFNSSFVVALQAANTAGGKRCGDSGSFAMFAAIRPRLIACQQLG